MSTQDRKDFAIKMAPVARAFAKIKNLGHVGSVVFSTTSITLALYGLAESRLQASTWILWIGAALALFFAVAIEAGTKYFLPLVVRQVVGKFYRSGPQRFILAMLLVMTAGFLVVNPLTTINGGKFIGANTVGDFQQTSTESLDSTRASQLSMIESGYDRSAALIKEKYREQAAAVQQEYASRISASQQKEAHYRSLNREKHQWAVGSARAERVKQSKLTERRDAKKAKLIASMNSELADLQEKHQDRLTGIDTTLAAQYALVNKKDQVRIKTHATLSGASFTFFHILAWVFVAIVVVGTVASEYYHEYSEHHDEQEELMREKSPANRFMDVLSKAYLNRANAWIDTFEAWVENPGPTVGSSLLSFLFHVATLGMFKRWQPGPTATVAGFQSGLFGDSGQGLRPNASTPETPVGNGVSERLPTDSEPETTSRTTAKPTESVSVGKENDGSGKALAVDDRSVVIVEWSGMPAIEIEDKQTGETTLKTMADICKQVSAYKSKIAKTRKRILGLEAGTVETYNLEAALRKAKGALHNQTKRYQEWVRIKKALEDMQ